MEPSAYYQSAPATGNSQNLLIVVAIGILAAVSILFIVLSFVGYGTLKIDMPAGTEIQINGHSVHPTASLKMVPGTYEVIVSSPTVNPYVGTVGVGLFKTTTLNPKLQLRSPAAVTSSLLGGVGASGAPQPVHTKWFDNNTWLAGVIVPGNADFAFHYDSAQSKWTVSFYNGGGYPDNTSALPANVASYVQTLEAQDAGQ
jgi:hypothetical protein